MLEELLKGYGGRGRGAVAGGRRGGSAGSKAEPGQVLPDILEGGSRAGVTRGEGRRRRGVSRDPARRSWRGLEPLLDLAEIG